MRSYATCVSFLLVLLVSVHASQQQHRDAMSQRSTEDNQLSQTSDPAKELMDAADGLSAEVDSLVGGPPAANPMSALLDVGAAHTSADSSSLLERERMRKEVEGLQEEVSELQMRLTDVQMREQNWRAVAAQAQQQRQAATKQIEDKTKKITHFAKAATDREVDLKKQLESAQERSKDYSALRGAREVAVQQASRWESRAREAEARLMTTLKAESAAEKHSKELEWQLREANESAWATRQEYQLAMRMSEDKAQRRRAELNQQLQAAEAKVRAADQRARTIDENAHAAIKMAKDKYKELQVAAVQQERTMAAEVEEAQALAQSRIDKAVTLLKPHAAVAQASKKAAPQRAMQL